ncbi:hypothetical protein [Clostridium tertium]|uniref:hypothetical protein n=1 Tax=Clostridium tertium TaxID=1559 RepID=UPI0018AC082B|nr:hypothetical protein [Clostridium tertium]
MKKTLKKKLQEERKTQLEKAEEWFEGNKQQLITDYREMLTKYCLEDKVIDFIKNTFNNSEKYTIEHIGREWGKDYYNSVRVLNYDVNKVYDEFSLYRNFLGQVSTGANVWGNYITFFDELREHVDEELYDLICKVCEKYEEANDNIQDFFKEELCELIGEYLDNIDDAIDWESMKKYVK